MGLTDGLVQTAQFGYKEDDIVMLTDDQNDPRAIPTKENMVRLLFPLAFHFCVSHPTLFLLVLHIGVLPVAPVLLLTLCTTRHRNVKSGVY